MLTCHNNVAWHILEGVAYPRRRRDPGGERRFLQSKRREEELKSTMDVAPSWSVYSVTARRCTLL